MAAQRVERFVVLSDMHFGTPESSVNAPRVIAGLRGFLAALDAVDEVIFSGDILDLNLSTFTKSIEGGDGLLGFREFLADIVPACERWASGCQWVYLPGNHDYKIWDLLSTKIACTDVLASGSSMGTVKTPLENWCWPDGTAFVAGVFPAAVRANVVVEYPDRLLADSRILVTHGHYLDSTQTLFKHLDELIAREGSVENAVRRMFIETAQYQAVAAAVSFTKEWRRRVNAFVGPSSIWARIKRWFARLFGTEADPFASPLRGASIDTDQIRNIEHYLMHFRRREVPPRYFVFGHTHVQDRSSTKEVPATDRLYKDREIDVFNVGSFYPRGGAAATFLLIEVQGDDIHMLPHFIAATGRVGSTPGGRN